MSEPCRILILNERDPLHPQAGGAEIHVAEIFGRLASRGYQVTLAASGFPGGASRDQIQGMEIWRLARAPFYYPKVARACVRETRAGRFDIVVECLNKVPFYSPVYSAVPVLVLCHHLFGEVAFSQVSWPVASAVWCAERFIPTIYRARPFITISESSRDDLVARGLSAESIRVSYCGIQRPRVSVDPDRPKPQRVIYVGRLEPYKHVEVMLQAVARISGRFPSVEIVVVGRGSDRSRLEALAIELGIGDRTRFVGFVPVDERDSLLADSRVCVCPSEKEGWGLTVVEASATGTPVVATDAPGLRDSVQHGETGYLVADRDIEGFASRIAELLSDDDLAKRVSRSALAWSQRFDWDVAASEMADAILESRGGR